MEETTITYKELELTILYEYTPAVEEVLYDNDGAGHSGSIEYIDIWKVYIGSQDITALLHEDTIDEIGCLILENHE